MGAFFTNVQVHTGGRPAERVRASVIEAVRRWTLAGPFVEIAGDDPVAGRTALVGPADSQPWIAVYDSLAENQDIDLLVDLTQALSAADGALASLAILVHDSDLLELRLCCEGTLVDAYSSWPGYFDEISPEQEQALAGRPELWRDLLAAGESAEDLRQVWNDEPLFAEELLQDVADVLGLNPERCSTGFTYLSQESELLGFARLNFAPQT
jgi:hypothetical protein